MVNFEAMITLSVEEVKANVRNEITNFPDSNSSPLELPSFKNAKIPL